MRGAAFRRHPPQYPAMGFLPGLSGRPSHNPRALTWALEFGRAMKAFWSRQYKRHSPNQTGPSSIGLTL